MEKRAVERGKMGGLIENPKKNPKKKGVLLIALLNKSVGNPEQHLKDLSQVVEIVKKWEKGENLSDSELYYLSILATEIPELLKQKYLLPYLDNTTISKLNSAFSTGTGTPPFHLAIEKVS